MKRNKKLGIWMDNSIAHIMEFSEEPFEVKTIESKFKHQEKEKKLAKGESFMFNKEQQLQSDYYKKIGNVIANYNDVLLFGPTNAKKELYNLLKEDSHYSGIKIKIMETDKMNPKQKQAFVIQHFSEV